MNNHSDNGITGSDGDSLTQDQRLTKAKQEARARIFVALYTGERRANPRGQGLHQSAAL